MAKTAIHTRNEAAAASASGKGDVSTSAGAMAAGEHPSRANAASPAAMAPQARVTKLGKIRAWLAAPGGTSLAALCEATGWQSHSVRAALTGLRKAGVTIEKGKAEDGTTMYRLSAAAEDGK